MFDVYIGEVELTELMIYASVVVILPIQLFLCFKVKKLWLRLLPIATFLTLIISFLCMSQMAKGWNNIGYIILAMFVGILFAAAVVGWGIWFAIMLFKRKENAR